MTNAKKYVRGVIVIAVLLALSLAAVIVCVGIGAAYRLESQISADTDRRACRNLSRSRGMYSSGGHA